MKKQYAVAAFLGGVLWIVLNLALAGAWDRGNTFPTYEFLNGVRPLPLAFLAFALYGVNQSITNRTGRAARTGFLIAVAGFGLLALGAALEFWVGGGVRDGDLDTISLAGWTLYLIGYLVTAVGLILFGRRVWQARAWGDSSFLLLLTGLVWAAWFPLVILDQAMQTATSEWVQLVFGGMWIVMGMVMTRQPQASSHVTLLPNTDKQ